MNLREFTRMVEIYGASPERWPSAQRAAGLSFARQDASATPVIARAQVLDDALDRYEVPVDSTRITTRIVARLPATPMRGAVEQLLEWLFPDRMNLNQLWRPMFAASLLLVVGVVVGSTVTTDFAQSEDMADAWDEEIYLLALVSDPESLP
jgi:hypothetical protein